MSARLRRFAAGAAFAVVASVVQAGVVATPAQAAAPLPALPSVWAPQPSVGPIGRNSAGMAYDAARGQTVLFGGWGNGGDTGALSDTWTWDGSVWTQQSPPTSPSGRQDAGMAYDAARGQVVLFGGWNWGGSLGDTWTWNGSTWTKRTPATSPSARAGAKMVYDAARGQVLLFGGGSNETWTWNGSTWTKQSPASSPSARSNASMTYDAVRGQVVLFGGTASGDSRLGDTWTWNGSTWTQRTAGIRPSARADASMAFDSASGQTVLFGGHGPGTTFSSLYDDTWTWNGLTWTEQSPVASPQPRYAAQMVYDASMGKVMLFGGWDASHRDDMWTWCVLGLDCLGLPVG